jgi:hypothetical protein
MLLLLTLAAFPRAAPQGQPWEANPFRWQLSAAVDEHAQVLVRLMGSVRVAFGELYRTLGRVPMVDGSAALLYLLSGNSQFRAHCLARPDPEAILVPLCRVLYDGELHDPRLLYVLLATLVRLCDSVGYVESWNEITIESISWVRPRRLTNVVLSSLVAVTLVRLINCNLAQLRDEGLHQLLTASLLTVVPVLVDVHHVAADAVVRLMLAAEKRRQAAPSQESDEFLVADAFFRDTRAVVEVAVASLSNPALILAICRHANTANGVLVSESRLFRTVCGICRQFDVQRVEDVRRLTKAGQFQAAVEQFVPDASAGSSFTYRERPAAITDYLRPLIQTAHRRLFDRCGV